MLICLHPHPLPLSRLGEGQGVRGSRAGAFKEITVSGLGAAGSHKKLVFSLARRNRASEKKS